MITKVTLEGQFEGAWVSKEFEFHAAQNILRSKKRNPSQTWRLVSGSDYVFDGVDLKKKPIEPSEVVVDEDPVKKKRRAKESEEE